MFKLITCLAIFYSSLNFAAVAMDQDSDLFTQAELNNPRAQYQLYQAYVSGDGVTKSKVEAFYWLKQAALNRYKLAQYELVEQYLSGGLTKPDTNKAILWLTKLAIAGDDKAQFELGQLYENRAHLVDTQSQAKLWYQIAAESNPEAEQAYNQLLEYEFNQRRAKQLAEFEQLDEQGANDASSFGSLVSAKLSSFTNSSSMTLSALVVGVICLGSLAWRKKQMKAKKQAASFERQSAQIDLGQSENHKLKKQLAQQDLHLQKQRQQIEALYGQLKKRQHSDSKPAQAQTRTSTSLSLACAMFGFSEKNIPEVSKIKQRYKQLCKIYHPDLKGSDEEMKRLNLALKTIIDSKVTKR